LPEEVYGAVREAFSKAEGEAKTKWQGLT